MDVAILDLAEALRTGNRVMAGDALGKLGAGPLDFVVPIVRAWMAADAGGDPVALLDAARTDGLARRYIVEHRALLLIATRRTDEGLAAIRAQAALDGEPQDLRTTAAMALAARGQRSAARDLLGEDAAQTRIRKVRLGAAFGASRLFARLGSDLAGQNAETLTIALMRATLLLDPADDRSRLLLAEALKADGAIDSALATLASVPSGSPAYAAAQGERIRLIQARGEEKVALDSAAARAALPDAVPGDRQLYADMLVEAGRDAEAATVYAQLLDRRDDAPDWTIHLQLGGALERAGRWDQALPHLRRAVELGPNQPVALNYLGYALVDRGQDVAAGRQLLERASKLRPDDPSITDSLGWSYFRTGDNARALPLLERAAQGNPASATINEHLGDAYWTAGRRFEARYAWRAAALHAEGEQQARIAGKLANGLTRNSPKVGNGVETSRWLGARAQRRVAARDLTDQQRMAAP